MKKSILIGALAVMMLFAFTACEPSAINVPGQGAYDVANIVIDSTTVYAGTEYASGSNTVPAQATIVYKDAPSTSNVALALTVEADSTPVAGTNFGTVSYGAQTSYAVSYEAIAITGITLDLSKVTTTVAYSADMKIENIPATYTWADGHTDDVTVTAKVDAATSKATVTVDSKYTTAEVSQSFDVTITGAPEAKIQSVTGVYDNGKAPIVGSAFNPSLLVVTATYVGGSTEVLDADEYLIDYASGYKFAEADKTTAVTVTITTKEGSVVGYCQILATDDYINNFSVSAKTTEKDGTTVQTNTYNPGSSITVDQFDFKATAYAVKNPATAGGDVVNTPENSFAIVPGYSKVPTGYTETSYTVYFYVIGHPEVQNSANITVTKPQA